MVDVFTIVIKKLQELGAFNFLFPFMLSTAIFYGLLRKSKIFSSPTTIKDKKTGEERTVEGSQSVNAIIALVAGFLVWAYPILAGVNIEQQLSVFFMQGMVVTLVFVIALMLASMFMKPDLPKQLEKALGGNKAAIILIIAVVIGVIIFATSGLLNLIIGPVFEKIDLSNDTVLSVVVLGLLIIPFIFIFRSGGEEQIEETDKKTPGEED